MTRVGVARTTFLLMSESLIEFKTGAKSSSSMGRVKSSLRSARPNIEDCFLSGAFTVPPGEVNDCGSRGA